MEKYIIGTKVIEITSDIIENIIVTALEGGSNHWYYLPKSEVVKVREAVSREEESALSMAIYKAVFEKGVSVTFCDAEEPSEEVGVLSKDTALERLKQLAENTSYNSHIFDEINGNGDAISSDVCFQFMVLGDVWFC